MTVSRRKTVAGKKSDRGQEGYLVFGYNTSSQTFSVRGAISVSGIFSMESS